MIHRPPLLGGWDCSLPACDPGEEVISLAPHSTCFRTIKGGQPTAVLLGMAVETNRWTPISPPPALIQALLSNVMNILELVILYCSSPIPKNVTTVLKPGLFLNSLPVGLSVDALRREGGRLGARCYNGESSIHFKHPQRCLQPHFACLFSTSSAIPEVRMGIPASFAVGSFHGPTATKRSLTFNMLFMPCGSHFCFRAPSSLSTGPPGACVGHPTQTTPTQSKWG